MKGSEFYFNRKTYKDELTGVSVTRITDNKAHYDRPYFTSPQFTSDSRYTLFVSDLTGTSRVKNPAAPAVGKIGFGELFLLELQTGKAIQLTEGEAIKMGHGAHAMLAPNGSAAYYYSNEELKSVNLSTLETKTLMTIPHLYNFHSLSLSSDCRYLLFSLVEEVPLITPQFSDPFDGTAPGARERYFKEPSSLIIRYDLQLQKGEAVFGGHHRITHANLKPDDGNKILFCHDGPWDLVQRMWTVDASTDVVKPLIAQKRNLEQVVHEYFTPSGRIGAQYSYRYRPDIPYFVFADIFVDFDGQNEERYYYPYKRPEHVSVGIDESLGVGDSCMLTDNAPQYKKYLSLIHYNNETHKAEPSLLCCHNSSGRKYAHVHPVFTPDNQHIIYSSDCDGKLNIYMVPADLTYALKTMPC